MHDTLRSPAPVTDLRETRWLAKEIKFVADASLQPELVEWARARLGPDGHGSGPHADEYLTSTLYFETPRFDVYRRLGSYGRSKYRVRQYGQSDRVFLDSSNASDCRLRRFPSSARLSVNWTIRSPQTTAGANLLVKSCRP